ncbi:hypothetical protein DPEC_G00085250 [Dallia pectoralis]|uniref:Uncharacterized protein n=1 Tax=Dallia pectoralis TaxID=75939 RepID=A0ACC2GZY7_DALPE|nr:hypothetical protein DPEC_G00085250 [Dallia pectoralis]
MDLTTFYCLTTTFVFMLENEVYSDFTSTQERRLAEGHTKQLAERSHRREKRCSCENLNDKECVYFCHIGIVWVNTPSHTAPYGLGSFPVRRKREVGRCFCVEGRDFECRYFCSAVHSLKSKYC